MEGGKPLYNGFSDALFKMYKEGGIRSLYRGLLPNYMKSIPAVAVSFAIFEGAKDLLYARNWF